MASFLTTKAATSNLGLLSGAPMDADVGHVLSLTAARRLWADSGLELHRLLPAEFWTAFFAWIDTDTLETVETAVTSTNQNPAAVRQELCLLGADPGKDPVIGTIPELSSAPGYVRQPIAWGAVTGTHTAEVGNTVDVIFGPFTASSGSGGAATHLALVLSDSAGANAQVAYVWQLDVPTSAGQGESLLVSAQTLRMALD